MADSTLDDFFAKKDKSKKGKKTSKFTTSDTIAKKLEGGKKIELIPKKDIKEKVPLSSNNQSSIIIPSGSNEQEDDEWKNIEEKETDYSGLRIQALSISEKEKEEEQQREQMLSEQNGDSNRMNDGQSGPWKVMQNPSMGAECDEEKSSSENVSEVKEEPAPVSKPTGAYKPPALRNITASSSPSSNVRRHPKHAPQITSEVHFPSLSSAVDSKFRLSEADRSFQSVKHGVRSKGESQKELHLDLENKFSALND